MLIFRFRHEAQIYSRFINYDKLSNLVYKNNDTDFSIKNFNTNITISTKYLSFVFVSNILVQCSKLDDHLSKN